MSVFARWICLALVWNFNSGELITGRHDGTIQPAAQPIDDPNNRIVGGSNVKNPIPYQISMQYKKNDQYSHFCGGSIIGPQHVLTAAHCVNGMDKSSVTILDGITKLSSSSDGTRHNVDAFVIHENYKELQSSDIAVLKISPPFEFNGATVDKIDFTDRTEIGDNFPVTLTGWGSISPLVYGPYPDNLQILNYSTITNEKCRERGFDVTETEICARKFILQGACSGDSGGPLVNREMTKQIGIVSYGTAICAIGVPDAYTRVSVFVDWIQDKIDNL